MLHTTDGATPQRVCYAGQGRGFPVHHESANCWYLDSPPHGLPERYRKADEYRLLNNKHGIYIFGTDSFRLVAEWNKATSASI